MDKQSAVLLVDQYFREYENPLDLDSNQILVVVHGLMKMNSADIKDVARIAKREFPMRLSANRYNRTEQPTQSQEERNQMLRDFFTQVWPRYFSHLEPVFADEAGTIVRPEARLSYAALKTAFAEMDGVWTPGRILAKVSELSVNNLLVKRPTVVERIVEKEVTPQEQAKRDRALDRRMNDRNNEITVKGIGDHHKVATQAEILEAAQQHAKDNESANNIITTIGNHRGKSRGATAAEKEILETIVAKGREANTPWATIEAQVNAQIATMRTWDATQAIRVTMAEKAARKNINMMERPKNPYVVDGSAY